MILLSFLGMLRLLQCIAPPSRRPAKKTLFLTSFYPFPSATLQRYTPSLQRRNSSPEIPYVFQKGNFKMFGFFPIFKRWTVQILTSQLLGFVLLHCGYMPNLLQWLCKNLVHQTMFAFSPFLPEKSIKSKQLNTVLGITEI